MESSRRQQAQADLGMDFAKEDQKREAALAKEQARADKKAAKREKMMNMPSYSDGRYGEVYGQVVPGSYPWFHPSCRCW